MEKDPRKRHSREFLPPHMSELRIVQLGRCGEEKSKVGNIILRREAFETQHLYFTVEQQCERATGLVDGSHVTVINTPDLLHPQLSQYEIDKQVELCVSLSDPGPHVLLLVLQPDRFTEQDRDRMKRILTALGDPDFEYSMVLITHEDKTDEQKDSVRLLIEECRGRYHKFNNINNTDPIQIFEFMEKINTVVKENEERYLTCEIFKDVESGAKSIPKDSQTRCAQDVEREYELQSPGEKETHEEHLDISTQKERRASMDEPPSMSALRIVLLGKSGEVKCKVGNAILGTDPFSVRDQCERKQTEVNGKQVAVINTPDFLDPELTGRKLSHQIETCVNLSAPGPHAFLLVLQDGWFSDDDRKRLEMILSLFSVEAFKYSMVLVTHSSVKRFWGTYIRKDPVQKVVEKCNKRSHSFHNLAEINSGKVLKLMEKIEKMVRENGGGFLSCGSEALGSKEGSLTETALKRRWKPQPLPGTKWEMEVTTGERLNLVVFGRRGAGKTSAVDAILGQRETSVDLRPSSVYESREGEVCGRLVTVVELPAQCEVQLSVSTVSHLFTSVCGSGIHAFLLVIQVGSLTDEDKAEITRIQEIFGSRVTDYMMVLFIHETPTAEPVVDFVTQRKEIQEPLKICSNRFCIFNNQVVVKNPIVPELLEAVEKMYEEAGSCFTLDMYWESQLERTVREQKDRYNTALAEKDRKIRELEENIKGKSLGDEVEGQISDCVRIVLVGKTGNGKSSTGNTILRRNEFLSEFSSSSVTTCCQKGVGKVAGRRVAVVDTPGLFDTSVNNEQVQQEIAKCISFLAPGPHVFLLVLQIGRVTQEEKETLQLIQETFGKMAEMFTIVLFTRGDELNKPIETFIQSSDPMLQNLIHNCGGRVQVFNNKDQSDITQVTELLEKIDMMVQKNGGGCYTNEMFQEAERTIKKECERILKEKEGEMQREREKLKAKHKEEMEEMKRRMEEQRCIEEEERARREKELKDKEENLKKEIETLKSREQEANERREEDEKRWKSQELAWKIKIDEKEQEKCRIKEELQHMEAEEKKRLETVEKERQELIEKQKSEKAEFEEKLAEEKKKRDTEEQRSRQLERTIQELKAKHQADQEEKDRKISKLEGNISGTALGVKDVYHQADCVRIVLVGRTGSGKSATGNSILQREEFLSGFRMTSVTTSCKKGVGDVAGRRVAVVDTPGLFDTSLTKEAVQEEITRCISFLAPGPHVFLLVLQIGRITKEEKDSLRLIRDTFGKKAEMFTIVMFTRGDNLTDQSIESYIKSSDPTIQKLIHDCGNRFHVFNNNDKSNVTQVTELLEKIDMMVQKNRGGCYTNEMFQEAERTIKKECERILREKEGEIQREREKLKTKHEEEMEEMKRRMEEQRCIEEEERARREKELKDKKENLKKEIETLKRREQEANERREEDEKRWRSQELELKSKIDEKEQEKCRIKEELQRREEEEKKRLETEEKERQELLQKQDREKREFEERLAEEKKKRDREEQERRNQEERERREWERRIKEAEKERKEIWEEMKKRAEEWELQREKERIRTEEEWKQKVQQERKEWEEKQKKMRDEFEKEKEQERKKRERDKEIMEKDLEEKKRQLRQIERGWVKERKEEREKRYKEDEQRREEERKRLVKLQEEFEKDREEENHRRKKGEKSRREREEKERREIEGDYERKMKEMKSKYEAEARRQAHELGEMKSIRFCTVL